MTFLEAALEVLKREGKPLHYKELTERAMGKKLLTFVGRTPEVTMQTQLTAAVKKAPGSPFVRVKPGVFGLLRYPEMPPEVVAVPKARAAADKNADKNADKSADKGAADGKASAEEGRSRRRRRRGGRGRTREGATAFAPNGSHKSDEADEDAVEAAGAEGEAADTEAPEGEGAGRDAGDREGADHDGGVSDAADEHEPHASKLSAEARAAALAETGVLEGDDDGEGDEDAGDLEEGASGAEAARADAQHDDADADAGDDDDDDDEDDDEPRGAEAEAGGAPAGRPGEGGEAGEEARTGRRRRRRRRRRYGEEGGAPGAQPIGGAPSAGGGLDNAGAEGSSAGVGAGLIEGD
jgi:hypothetical protein